MIGGILLGPLVMGDVEDTLLNIPNSELHNDIKALPAWDTVAVRHAEEILAAITKSIAGTSQSLYSSFVFEQEKMLSELYRMKDEWQTTTVDSEFLIRSEKKLYNLINSKDKEGDQKIHFLFL